MKKAIPMQNSEKINRNKNKTENSRHNAKHRTKRANWQKTQMEVLPDDEQEV